MNLKYKPSGYSDIEMQTRAKKLCIEIIRELDKGNIPAVVDLDSEDHYRIVLTVANEQYNVMEIHEIFERRHPTGKFKFKYHRIYVSGVPNCTCRMYEQTELAKKYSLVKVVAVLKDRYQAIQSSINIGRNRKDTEKARKTLVANLCRDFPGFKQYIQDSPTTDVELRFRVDDKTARQILVDIAIGGGLHR